MKKAIALILSIGIMLAFFGCAKSDEASSDTTVEVAEEIMNPLTGEKNFNPDASGKRNVALVVENHPDARPQWGLGTADIVAEFEVEGGISRMLWLYADFTSLPEQVGPMRSARPPLVEFSEFFDAIFIHWGGSHSSGVYTGGYETISADMVDDLDGMSDGELFGRDSSRYVSSEHTGVLYGSKLADAIAQKGFSTDIKDGYLSSLAFNGESVAPGELNAERISSKFSSISDTREFTYSAESEKYSTADWREPAEFKNVVILSCPTEYVTVPYQGSTTTYCNYNYTGGSGYYASEGKVAPITWSVERARLVLKDENGKELKLNIGKTYFGMISANNGGSVDYN